MANKKEFTLSFIVGLVLLPLSAIAAVALVGGNESAVEAAVVETTVAPPSTLAAEVPIVAGLSERDIWQACVPDATTLIEKEVAGTISDLEIAALDSLRAICEQEGLSLSGPPAPAPIVKTVRVNAPAPVSAAVAATTGAPSDGAVTTSDDGYAESEPEDSYIESEPEDSYTESEPEDGYDDDKAEDSEDGEDPYAGQSQYLAAHADAVAAIDAAVAAGGKADKIDEARKQLAEGEAKADKLDFWSALEKAFEAKDKANEAISERGDD